MTVTNGSLHELADSMRRGAALRPQATNMTYFGRIWTDDDVPGGFCSCALGATAEGTDGPYKTYEVATNSFERDDLVNTYPCLSDDAPACPVSPCDGSTSVYLSGAGIMYGKPTVEDMINHLNEFHKWTREDTAAWLDSLGAA